MRDQELLREVAGHLLDVRPHAGTGRQHADVAGRQIDTMRLPVLVAALLAEVNDVPVVVHPRQPRAEAAVRYARERPGFRDVAQRRDPEVQHAVERSEEREARAIRADPRPALVGIAEQHPAWDERGSAASRRARRLRRGR